MELGRAPSTQYCTHVLIEWLAAPLAREHGGRSFPIVDIHPSGNQRIQLPLQGWLGDGRENQSTSEVDDEAFRCAESEKALQEIGMKPPTQRRSTDCASVSSDNMTRPCFAAVKTSTDGFGAFLADKLRGCGLHTHDANGLWEGESDRH